MNLLPSDSVGDFSAKLHQHILDCAMGAEHKEIAELSTDEKFAIAFVAGVPVCWKTAEDGTTARIHTQPCSITKIDGKFKVFIKS